jgi:hypothetical protein
VKVPRPLEHRVELLRAVDGQLLPVSADAEGPVRSKVLGAAFTTVESALRISWDDGSADL